MCLIELRPSSLLDSRLAKKKLLINQYYSRFGGNKAKKNFSRSIKKEAINNIVRKKLAGHSQT